MKKSFLTITFLIVIIGGVSLLYKKKPQETMSKNTLNAPLYFDISTLHYCASNKGSYVNSSQVIPYVFEGLMRRGEGDVPMPAIAHKVDISEDGKTYTFYRKIQSGVMEHLLQRMTLNMLGKCSLILNLNQSLLSQSFFIR